MRRNSTKKEETLVLCVYWVVVGSYSKNRQIAAGVDEVEEGVTEVGEGLAFHREQRPAAAY